MDAHEGQAAWAQFAGAMIALFVALGLGITQAMATKRHERRAERAYLTGAVAAIEHAEAAMDEVRLRFSGMQRVERAQLEMSPALPMLDAVEAALGALPLHQAPSDETARALVTAQFHIRRVSGNFRAFLADPLNSVFTSTYEDEINEVVKAAIALRKEQRRISRQHDP